MARRLPFLTFLLVLAWILPARADDTWKVFQVPGQFQVEIPGEPTHSTLSGDPPTESWVSDSGEPLHGFEILLTEHPRGSLRDVSEDGVLIATMQGRARALGGQPTRTRRIMSQRLPGCTFRVLTEDADWDFMVRISEDRVYTLSVSSMKGEGEDGSVERFFNSFHVP
jgi:hypothetical protein